MIKKVIIENTDLWLTKSDSGFKIKQVADRLGQPIPDVEYGEAVDIDVNGQPRYDYIETENLVEVPEDETEGEEQETETNENE